MKPVPIPKCLTSSMWAATLVVIAAACSSGGDAPAEGQAVSVPYTNGEASAANPVAYWNLIATNTINQPANPNGTPEEARTVGQVDLATVHVAIYDAVIAIAGTHLPFAVTPTTPAEGASQEAAAAAAANGVLQALFPSRSAQYRAAYEAYVSGLPEGEAKTRGLAIGAEVAAKVTSLRANDGRMAQVAYTAGSGPGQFRGTNPIGTFNRFIRPFTLTSASQFRPAPPPPLNSAEYATDFNEVRALGGMNSTQRTPEQLQAARAHTEAPATYPTRNYRSFAMAGRGIADNARLMAMLWVAQADANIACFEAKYHYDFWRPRSAISLADTDGNAATDPDASWAPVLATPNHPEYPSAHMCQNSASAAVLKAFFGTSKVSFTFGSTVTNNTRQYASPDDLLAEITLARITGGMHFRNSNVQGGVLGTQVGEWVVAHHFRPR